MNILLTNDDGYNAPGLAAALHALREFGTVHVVAPHAECSTCSHRITLNKSITVRRSRIDSHGSVFAVEGTPADCVRLALTQLLDVPIDLVVSGVNPGANSGIDVFYSGTVAGAREAAILNVRGIALSQALRRDMEPNWKAVTQVIGPIVRQLMDERLPGPGFWSVNLPAPIPADAHERIHRVPLEPTPPPLNFDRIHRDGEDVIEFRDRGSYWTREVTTVTDYSVIRDGGIAVTAVPLYGRF